MSNQSTEKALILRFQSGDAYAFNTVYNRYYSTLRYFSFRLLSRKREAETIAIDTFIKLYRLCRNFESMAGIRAFLYVTARNACYDYLAYARLLAGSEPESTDQPVNINDTMAEPDTEREMDAIALADAIRNLPAEYYQVFKMAYLQGHKANSIARHLRVKEQAVRTYKRRAIQLLRIALFEKDLPSAALTCLSMVKAKQAVAGPPLPSPLYIVAVK